MRKSIAGKPEEAVVERVGWSGVKCKLGMIKVKKKKTFCTDQSVYVNIDLSVNIDLRLGSQRKPKMRKTCRNEEVRGSRLLGSRRKSLSSKSGGRESVRAADAEGRGPRAEGEGCRLEAFLVPKLSLRYSGVKPFGLFLQEVVLELKLGSFGPLIGEVLAIEPFDQ
ncbi:hypothetical protein Cni_G16942 [Canna indica]|uniref:Uncharacterized protein n=1 Tax=Canna indica TaxID=4628 RepID=A0AAQ3QHA5_9LILI|nr:hypothetical protein Cni_G16942 [Canna indica]